jgi:hypothetical protein
VEIDDDDANEIVGAKEPQLDLELERSHQQRQGAAIKQSSVEMLRGGAERMWRYFGGCTKKQIFWSMKLRQRVSD